MLYSAKSMMRFLPYFSVGLLCLLNGYVLGQEASANSLGPRQPTIKEYLEQNPGSYVVAPGKAIVAGKRMNCGRRPIIYDPLFSSHGGAYQGYIILNPNRMKGLPAAVQRYIFAHECGHQFRGRDEKAADCYSVQRGRRNGWLNKRGMDQVCRFISVFPKSAWHPPGPERCRLMRACFKNAYKYKKR